MGFSLLVLQGCLLAARGGDTPASVHPFHFSCLLRSGLCHQLSLCRWGHGPEAEGGLCRLRAMLERGSPAFLLGLIAGPSCCLHPVPRLSPGAPWRPSVPALVVVCVDSLPVGVCAHGCVSAVLRFWVFCPFFFLTCESSRLSLPSFPLWISSFFLPLLTGRVFDDSWVCFFVSQSICLVLSFSYSGSETSWSPGVVDREPVFFSLSCYFSHCKSHMCLL